MNENKNSFGQKNVDQLENCSARFYLKTGVSNSVSYVGHILTKKGSQAALRGKMSPLAAIGG